jgi:excisionase family DNA binding protein
VLKPQKPYGTAQAAKRVGVSKPTLLRWIAERKIADVARDHRGWRVFTNEDVKRIKREMFGHDFDK